jgi:hypothetical protein
MSRRRWFVSGALPALSALVFASGGNVPNAQERARSGPLTRADDIGSAGPSHVQPAVAAPLCSVSIRDQANPASCLQATSVPTPGLLFPAPHLGGVDNVQSGTNSFVGGGSENQASAAHSAIGGGQENLATGGWATVGGGWSNEATSFGATVGGGHANRASNNLTTVGGGGGNYARADGSTIAGGRSNECSGAWGEAYFAYNATIGGGAYNLADGSHATIGGGFSNGAGGGSATIGGGTLNSAPSYCATIAGGNHNSASGPYAAVAGGAWNTAAGDYSFAAGRRAKANHSGAFVWGDGQDADKSSSAENEFNVYASGGARIFSNAAATSGVLLAPGGGSWSSVSDRASKENLAPVDGPDVLARVCALPISTWNYEAQDDSVRHMGPMAQDFRAAFGLGVSEKLIDTVDPDGVALAAIQGLNARLDEKESEIEGLRRANAELYERLERLESLEERLALVERAPASRD